MKMRLQYPVKTGDHLGLYDATSVNNTNWNDLSSEDFKSSSTGSAVPIDLEFGDLSVYNGSNNVAYIKLRAKNANNDPTTNELIVLAGGILSFNTLGLQSGSVETISFKKTAGTDPLIFTSSFNRKDV
jgi:hypothetical protein